MKNKYRYLIKNTGILAISNFSSKILVFFLVPIYTSILSTSEYSIYELVYSFIQLLFPILTANICDATMRYLMDKNIEQKKIISLSFECILFSIILFSLICFMLDRFNVWNRSDGIGCSTAIVFFISYVLASWFSQIAKGMEAVTTIGAAGVLGTISVIFFNVFFLIVIKNGLKGFFIANILGQAIPALFYLFRLRIWKYISIEYDKDLMKKMLAYCVPLLFSTIGWWINSASDKYTLVIMVGNDANGLLSVAYKIPSVLNVLQTIFIQAWQISAIKEYSENDSKTFYGITFEFVNCLMCVSCTILIFFVKLIAGFMFSNSFYEAWRYVPFLLISSVMNSASGFIGPVLSAKKNSRAMASSAIYGSAVNIILNIILIYLIGIQGATIATIVGSFVIYFVRYRKAKTDMIICYIKSIYAVWILLIAQAALFVYLDNQIINILMVLCILFACLNNLKKIKTHGLSLQES